MITTFKTFFTILTILFSISSYSQKPKLKVGKKAPLFELQTSKESQFELNKILKSGKKVVLVFYQGSWNPYDVKYLKKLQAAKDEIESKNGVLVFVTREKFSYINKLKTKENIDLLFCNDADWYVMSMYGLAYKLSKGNLPTKFKFYSYANATHTGSKDDMVPIPATFVIGLDQKIIYMHYDSDYRQHPEVSEIINSL